MADGSKTGWVFVVAGAAAAAVGTILIIRSRRQSAGLGKLERSDFRRNGMTTKTYYSKNDIPIRQRVLMLQGLVEKSVKDPTMRKLALGMTAGCKARDGDCEARAIYHAVKNHVRYTGDIAPIVMASKPGRPVEGIDLFQSAPRTWEFKGGDCDDHSTLIATMLALNGIPAKFRITGKSRDKNDPDYSHIYPMAGLPKTDPTRWVALDSTIPFEAYAIEAPAGKRVDFDI